MIQRRLNRRLTRLLKDNPAVALIGPRQVGKTTLALEIAKAQPSLYLDLERPADLAKLQDPELFLSRPQDKLVILDEVHRAPELFQPLRGIIDEGRRKGRRGGQFLFLGSASIDLLKQSSETLAGRIAFAELHPLDALEVEQHDDSPHRLDRLWLRGGFPDSYLAGDDEANSDWRLDFIRTYLERDVPQLGPRIPAETLRRFWTMLAHGQGGQLNASRLAVGLGVSGQTVGRYLDLLVDLLLVRRLAPWTANVGKRLVKSPKVYVRDSGLTHALLGIEALDDLMGHPVVGPSWEGFVIENILSATRRNVHAYYYRTSAGAEIDLVLALRPDRLWAVEVKRTLSPSVGKGFLNACEDIGADRRFIVYPGSIPFPVGHETTAVPLTYLMNELTG